MNISVFGLGYVGCVSAGCLARNGHFITGIDINDHKVDLINSGKPTVIEAGMDDLIRENRENGRISATSDYNKGVKESQVAFICVGTPSDATGKLDLDHVLNTARQIGQGIKNKDDFFIVVIRSTVLPGTNEHVCQIIEDASNKERNIDFAVVSNPEFLREGSAVEDYDRPAMTVIGSDNTYAINVLKEIYNPVNAPFVVVEPRIAELIKYINNSFHALKISFANEVGNICKALEIDSHKVMELFKMDNRLNISPAYLNPGMAFGGSCLPKDLKGLATIAHDHYINTPVINSISLSNENQKERVSQLIRDQGKSRIGIFGLAFKKGTDDLRYSPSVFLIENLLGKGFIVKTFDRNVVLARLTGANRSYIEEHLPHISNLLVSSFSELVNHAEVMVITHKPEPDELGELRDYNGTIIDLINIDFSKFNTDSYIGFSW